jgi:hypothetical protein
MCLFRRERNIQPVDNTSPASVTPPTEGAGGYQQDAEQCADREAAMLPTFFFRNDQIVTAVVGPLRELHAARKKPREMRGFLLNAQPGSAQASHVADCHFLFQRSANMFGRCGRNPARNF